MIDKEKVIKGLECCGNHKREYSCSNCPYEEYGWEGNPSECTEILAVQALALLKEQEQTIENLNDIIAIHEGC